MILEILFGHSEISIHEQDELIVQQEKIKEIVGSDIYLKYSEYLEEYILKLNKEYYIQGVKDGIVVAHEIDDICNRK